MYFIDIQTKYCISVQFLAKFCMISKSDDELMNGILYYPQIKQAALNRNEEINLIDGEIVQRDPSDSAQKCKHIGLQRL